ncbi:family 43 glycosylhydrolase [Paenibacillus qinlingensis]|uniref:family 43 glycosylhydrolase n=1 Tax=Paenibacillus qinlingensis TaxID=1837343 RepID=UPI001567749E|nr:family 43 glycosylhydrolase [Paenibacillus qinlingensis]NQX64371.1 family 43 glycosylhydrolase [Paenibacillus qinlingensis]
MKFADMTAGIPYAKDPAVVSYKGKYFLYYSRGPFIDGRWGIGVAESTDLDNWTKIGEVPLEQPCEAKGICAPGAIVLEGRVHLFYQTYGNFPKDAICHAVSEDGLTFTKNETNPIFAPTGAWNNGRAIDADVVVHDEKLFLYFATRDPKGEIQMQGVATAPLHSDYGRSAWTQASTDTILKPELAWEGACIEAAAMCKREGKLYMFYAGAYNNAPQQIGCAISEDGIRWERLFAEPLLPNGEPGSWNSSESGHPFLFVDQDERTYLFYQGNNDMGKTWYLSKIEIGWENGLPFIIQQEKTGVM